MPRFVLDTNVYVDALRSPAAAVELKRFLATALPVTSMSAVVMMELRSGARTPEQVLALEAGLFEPFARRGRVLVPSSRSYREVGRVLAELSKAHRPPESASDAFLADVLIAVSCREEGMTLVTRDADFRTISKHISGFRFVPPWP